LRVEVAPVRRIDAAARSAVQERDRLSARVAALLVVQRVQLRDAQLALRVGLDLGEELAQARGLLGALHGREASADADRRRAPRPIAAETERARPLPTDRARSAALAPSEWSDRGGSTASRGRARPGVPRYSRAPAGRRPAGLGRRDRARRPGCPPATGRT